MNDKILADAVERAIAGEITVLLYQNLEQSRYAITDRENVPKDCVVVINVSERYWRFPTGGIVMFRSVSMQPQHLQGMHAKIVFMDGAVFKASDYMMSVVAERNSVYEMMRKARSGMKEYYKNHKVCPVCGQPPSCSTYVGFCVPPDTNDVKCECGWAGITDDLVAEGEKEVLNGQVRS